LFSVGQEPTDQSSNTSCLTELMITAPSANYLMKIVQIVIHQDPKVCAHLCLQIDLDAGHHTIRQQYINNAGKATGADGGAKLKSQRELFAASDTNLPT